MENLKMEDIEDIEEDLKMETPKVKNLNILSFLNNVRVAMQINLIAGLAFVGFAIVGGMYYSSATEQAVIIAEQGNAEDAVDLAGEITFDFLNARKSEKDFFLTLNSKYVAEHREIIEEVTPQFKEMKGFHDEPEMLTLIDEVFVKFTKYAEQFYEVVGNWNEIGETADKGLRKKLNALGEEVNDDLKSNPKMLVIFQTMRAAERNFMLRLDPTYKVEVAVQVESSKKRWLAQT